MAQNVSDRFSVWLREQMTGQGLTGGVLARKLGVGPPTVYKWLNRETTPSTIQIPNLARAFGVGEEAVRQGLGLDEPAAQG